MFRIQLLDNDGEIVTPWLILDILPRLYESHIRSQALESTVDLISRRFSAFIGDISDALYEVHPPMDTNSKRINCLSLVLQKYKNEFGGNANNHASRPTKGPGGASTDTNEDDRYTVLTERIRVLEKMVQENRANTGSHQPFVMVEEPTEIAFNNVCELSSNSFHRDLHLMIRRLRPALSHLLQ